MRKTVKAVERGACSVKAMEIRCNRAQPAPSFVVVEINSDGTGKEIAWFFELGDAERYIRQNEPFK